MSTRRITVEEVLEAYRVTGVTPGRGSMKCCAMGAVLRSDGYEMDAPLDSGDKPPALAVFGEAYGCGFTQAFDGCVGNPDRWRNKDLERWKEGFADGQAVAAAVFQKQGSQA